MKVVGQGAGSLQAMRERRQRSRKGEETWRNERPRRRAGLLDLVSPDVGVLVSRIAVDVVVGQAARDGHAPIDGR